MKNSLFVSVLLGTVLATTTLAPAAPNNPPPAPPAGGDSPGGASRPGRNDPPELSFFSDGTQMLFKKQWAAAQTQLEATVAINEKMAEAHNNLAYVLRKQGAANYDKSLAHYNRAIELKPKLAEAYMYRGALYVLMGRPDLAQADYDTLLKMKSKLAPALKKVMDTGKEEEPEQFYGVIKKKK